MVVVKRRSERKALKEAQRRRKDAREALKATWVAERAQAVQRAQEAREARIAASVARGIVAGKRYAEAEERRRVKRARLRAKKQTTSIT
jgi:hypothetical protein